MPNQVHMEEEQDLQVKASVEVTVKKKVCCGILNVQKDSMLSDVVFVLLNVKMIKQI